MSRMKFEGLLENEFTLSDKVLRSKNGTDSGVIDVPVENLILDEENITIFGDFNRIQLIHFLKILKTMDLKVQFSLIQ